MNNTCDQELPPLLLLLLMIKTHSKILDRLFMCLQFFLVAKWAFFFMYNYPIRDTWLWTAKKRLNSEK
jgi:hypothetical protein